MGRIIIGIILVFIGLSALVGFSLFKFIFALLIIALGVRIISGGSHHNWHWDQKTSSSEDILNEVAIFSPVNKIVLSDNFSGGNVVMVFAGGEIDLSQVKTERKEVDMKFVTIFGGGKLIIPKGWTVNSKNVALVGAVNSEVEKSDGGTVLNLKGVTIFGGIDVVSG